MTEDILFEMKSRVGRIILNRPQALNALTLDMVRAMDRQLAAWQRDSRIAAVIVTSSDARAFCAGGDIKAVALAAKAGDTRLTRDFFYEEYTLNHRIHTFGKPYIALMDGIVMGGGKGISAHGTHRVVTDRLTFAMPETQIGFFPDVGGGYFLPRCPGQTGLYLALTGARIAAADALYVGFATHAVPSGRLDALASALTDNPEDVESILDAAHAAPAAPGRLEAQRAMIDAHFAHDRIEDILASLEKDPSPFSAETRAALRAQSPASLAVALRQIRAGAAMSFADVMTMEFRLSQALIRRPDFYEGVRAQLIDKDRAPRWRPATIEELDDADIAACFAACAGGDLVLE